MYLKGDTCVLIVVEFLSVNNAITTSCEIVPHLVVM